MNNIQQQLILVNQQIRSTAQQCGRDPKTITLLAVSKTKSVDQIQQAIMAGQYLFGENYVQEGVEKIHYFSKLALSTPLEWHFIGALQSNKSRQVATYFDWVHTVDRFKIAQRLDLQRPVDKAALNLLLQVNIDNEVTKSGIAPEKLMTLAAEVSSLPHLTLRGLMIIPTPTTNTQQQLKVCQRASNLFHELKTRYPTVDTLSMGMSYDMTSAIMAGSTMVRIGRAIFGQRFST